MSMTKTKHNRMLILNELYQQKNWRPVLSTISENTGIPLSTIHDVIKKMRKSKLIKLEIKITIDKDVLKKTKYL